MVNTRVSNVLFWVVVRVQCSYLELRDYVKVLSPLPPIHAHQAAHMRGWEGDHLRKGSKNQVTHLSTNGK